MNLLRLVCSNGRGISFRIALPRRAGGRFFSVVFGDWVDVPSRWRVELRSRVPVTSMVVGGGE